MRAHSTHGHVLVDRTSNRRHTVTPGEILAFAACRDERLRLPAFLKHYRGLGVDRFFIVDNDSSDGTTEYLAVQPDVHLFSTAQRYSEARNGIDWLNTLLGEFGNGSWCLTVDIDELLVYPGSERVSLHPLTDYLDQNSFEALACVLLDLYPSGPLHECRYDAGDDLFEAAPYFDAGPYEKSPVDSCPGVLITGGMRERVFYPEFRARHLGTKIYDAMCYHAALRIPRLGEKPWMRESRRRRPPCLTKMPLIRWDQKSRYLNVHWVSPKIVAPETGALLHFKFLHDFHDRAIREAARGEHYDAASEYQRYAEKLRQNPALTLTYAGSIRFEGTTQLARLGLMQDTERWADARVTGR